MKRASHGRCQAIIYNEDKGFFQCAGGAENLHHIEPETYLLTNGQDPNQADGLYLCKFHHIEGTSDVPFEGNFSFHPNFGEALQEYRDGNKNAFQEAADEASAAAIRGETYWNDAADAFYGERARYIVQRHVIQNPLDMKPTVKAHKDFKPEHWTDFITGKRADDTI